MNSDFVKNYRDPMNHFTARQFMQMLEKAGITDTKIYDVIKTLPSFDELGSWIVLIDKKGQKEKCIRPKEEKALGTLLGLGIGSWKKRMSLKDEKGFISGEELSQDTAEILQKAQSLLAFIFSNAHIPIDEPITIQFSPDTISTINITFLI